MRETSIIMMIRLDNETTYFAWYGVEKIPLISAFNRTEIK